MKKKHELLKYAYDNYPKGTRFSNLGLKNETSVSSGIFHIDDYGVRDSETSCYVLGTHNKWAEIIEQPKSILDGKVAIQVANEREFELLMKHYEEKGWRWFDNLLPFEKRRISGNFSKNISYKDDFESYFITATPDEYTIIPFSEFAEAVGIEVPKEIEFDLGGTKCVVTSNGISFSGPMQFIMAETIDRIHNSIQQLKGGENA